MFNNKLVVAIKNEGKVLREVKDRDGNVVIMLPFGTEYSIFIKNLNSVRALVKVELDGRSVTDGEDLVVYGNSEINLERFLKRDNLNQGNKFKFIERKASVEKARGGIQVEDGLLRVSFQFEKVTPQPVHVPVVYDYWPRPWVYPTYPKPWYPPYNPGVFYNAALGNAVGIGTNGLSVSNYSLSTTLNAAANSLSADNAVSCSYSADSAAVASVNTMSTNTMSNTNVSQQSISGGAVPKPSKGILRSKSVKADAEVNTAGITAPGSVSNQQFQVASWFPVETETYVIVLKLLGEVDGKEVEEAVTVKHKQTCPTCKTRNRGQNKFCRECGSALELVGPSSSRVGVRG